MGDPALRQHSGLHFDPAHQTPRPPAIDPEHQDGSYHTQGAREGEGFHVSAQRGAEGARAESRAGCTELRRVSARTFPFQGARVLVDKSLLALDTVWLEAGSPRHVLGLPPRQLLRLTHAETGTFLVED